MSQTIVLTVIQLAHALGMTVVAEGVETAQRRERLGGLGSDDCQGSYFAHPMAAAELEPLLDAGGDGLPTQLPIAAPPPDP